MMKQMKKTLALWIALALALPVFALAEDGAGDLAVEIVESAADIASAGVEGGDEVAAAGVEPEALPGGNDLSGGDEADSADLGALLDDTENAQEPSPFRGSERPGICPVDRFQ